MADNSVDEKEVVVAFLQFLEKSKKMEPDTLEVAQSMLKTAYGITDEKTDIDLLALCGAGKEKSDEFDEEKWKEFLGVLTGKGYFKGCEEGTDEYVSRMEKARGKFIARSNPYEGLNADQLKAKGNEQMSKGQYKPAVGFYSKAIELSPDNAVYYCNRAAAYTHLNQFAEAVRDCEKSTQLNPEYSKAFSRMGTAHFYKNNYTAAVSAFKKALELEPENESYKQDLVTAEEKASQPANMFDGMGGLGGLLANPQVQAMATKFMQNPQFGQIVENMSKNMNEEGIGQMAEMWGRGGMGAMAQEAPEGQIATPFGNIDKSALDNLHAELAAKDNSKFMALSEDLKKNGTSAIMKYMDDPEVVDAIASFSKLFNGPGAGGQ
eukprot:TRINITY_DN3503_c3_g1_i1.p1 TRINITY_DN3503_c3_g1~~TRINITY_DN3503_c3_g1_i1.p1  ORF type:complete len:378 (+),score=114.95 TRINITY_DN3503_c3_g1_i1:76-1209(+)